MLTCEANSAVCTSSFAPEACAQIGQAIAPLLTLTEAMGSIPSQPSKAITTRCVDTKAKHRLDALAHSVYASREVAKRTVHRLRTHGVAVAELVPLVRCMKDASTLTMQIADLQRTHSSLDPPRWIMVTRTATRLEAELRPFRGDPAPSPRQCLAHVRAMAQHDVQPRRRAATAVTPGHDVHGRHRHSDSAPQPIVRQQAEQCGAVVSPVTSGGSPKAHP